MANCQCVHIDQQHLVVLELEILGMIVTVDHIVDFRDIVYELDEFVLVFIR